MLLIRELRKKRGYTQDKLCSLSGIKKRTYIDYEQGKSDIPFSKLQKIASALDFDISDFLPNKPKPLDNSIQIKKINNSSFNDIGCKHYIINNPKELIKHNDELLEKCSLLQSELRERESELRERESELREAMREISKLKDDIIKMVSQNEKY